MNLGISELKSKWKKEKTYYQTQEVGSGVQKFVKDVLKSEEIFGLTECLKSTSKEQRKNEFLEEEKTKGQNKADIIIYISPEIVIPVEIERYQNITAGEKQLLDYQTHLDKQYGILTDGYSWRFYNNNIYREFDLNEILEETEVFLEFWREYIKPESYYLNFFEPQGQQSLFKKTDQLLVEQNRQIFFEDITNLIRSFKNKLQVEGYFKELDKKKKERSAIEITYAYIIQFILYKTLVDNSFTEFGDKFQKNIKDIHKYLKNKQYGTVLGILDGISDEISQKIYRPFAKEQESIRKKLIELWHNSKNDLSDVSPWLDIFIFIKKYDFSDIQNEIFGYIYENYLKELYEESKKGQYFTDPAVVNFMLEQIGFTADKLQERYQPNKSNISLVDPACGSGTFLYSAVNTIIDAFDNGNTAKSKQIEEIVINNIFGLDIAEFPLYLAEMSILMRMLVLIINKKYNNPVDRKIKVFKTNDSIGEFLPKLGQPLLDLKYQNLGYESYVREEKDLKEMKESLGEQNGIPRRRFDYVIGNPPYVGYNECSKQKVTVFEMMRKNDVKLSNIYGVNLHSVPNKSKKYPPKPNLYSFFIALGIALLKEDGRLCYIVPQTLLTEP